MLLNILLLGVVVGLVHGQANQEIAFSVGVSKDATLQHAEKVMYDTVFTNIGAGFNAQTSTFECPTSGIYVFQFHTLAQSNGASWLELYHNDQYIQSIYGHAGADYSSAGNSAILKLSKGDQVYVKAVDSSVDGTVTYIYGLSDEIYTTFSGYLVSPLNSGPSTILGRK